MDKVKREADSVAPLAHTICHVGYAGHAKHEFYSGHTINTWLLWFKFS